MQIKSNAKLVLSLLAILTLSACDDKRIACADPAGEQAIHSLLSEQIEKALKRENEFSISNIRASVSTLSFRLNSVRTTKEDPNSTKVFCEAKLVVTPPIEMLNDAKITLDESNSDIESLFERFNFEQSRSAANSYETSIVYDLQPSDDKKTIFAEVEGGQHNITNGIASFVYSSLAKNKVLAKIAQQKQAEIEAKKAAEEAKKLAAENEQRMKQAALEREQRLQQEALEREKQQAQSMEQRENLEKEQSQAEFAKAKAENKIAFELINSIWKGLTPETRKQLLPAQRAWIAEKDATCKKRALNSGLSGYQLEIFKLQCDTELSNQRSNLLRNQ